MKIRKAVIPAAGLGKRMMPLTRAQPKEMLPVVHKPVIHYVVEEAYQAGIRNILIITGKHKRAIEDYFDKPIVDSKDPWSLELEKILDEVNIYFTRQREQRGLADALRYAEGFIDNEPFALLLGDNITLPPCTKILVELFKRVNGGLIAVEKVEKERINKHGIVDIKEELFLDNYKIFKLKDVVEKPSPEKAPSNLAIIGRYILYPEIFEYIRNLKPGYCGELQLTDAIREMIRDGFEYYGVFYTGKRYDIGDKRDWLRANFELGSDERILE